MSHDKAVIINKFWAGIFATVIAAGVLGGVVYAFNANAQIAVLKHNVEELTEARLDTRVTRMEEQLKAANEKLDILIGRKR